MYGFSDPPKPIPTTTIFLLILHIGALSDKTVVSHYEILMFLFLFFPNSHRKIFWFWALITQKMLAHYLIVPVLSTFCFIFSTFLFLFVTIWFKNCSTHLFVKYVRQKHHKTSSYNLLTVPSLIQEVSEIYNSSSNDVIYFLNQKIHRFDMLRECYNIVVKRLAPIFFSSSW